MIDILQNISQKLISSVDLSFSRYFYPDLDSSTMVIGIVWERWVGKTTALLQYAREHQKSFYFSADNSIILSYGLFRFAYEIFDQYGVDHLMIDEIHKYDGWTIELKNIIDSFPEKKIIFSGSSSLDIIKWTASLERRVKMIPVFPLDLREFLQISYQISVPSFSLEEILSDYRQISFSLAPLLRPEYIRRFMRMGFYPYAQDFSETDFYQKVFYTLEKTILEDLPSFLNSQTATLLKVKKIFYFIAHTLPWDLNYSTLSKKIGIHQDTLENILFILSKIGVIHLLPRSSEVVNLLRKEFKIYLGNPNLYYSFNDAIDIGIVRECFVLHFLHRLITPQNELQVTLSLPRSGDIHFVSGDRRYIFEIGGKSKTKKQIQDIPNAFIISDDIMIGEGNKIPLWLFWLIRSR